MRHSVIKWYFLAAFAIGLCSTMSRATPPGWPSVTLSKVDPLLAEEGEPADCLAALTNVWPEWPSQVTLKWSLEYYREGQGGEWGWVNYGVNTEELFDEQVVAVLSVDQLPNVGFEGYISARFVCTLTFWDENWTLRTTAPKYSYFTVHGDH